MKIGGNRIRSALSLGGFFRGRTIALTATVCLIFALFSLSEAQVCINCVPSQVTVNEPNPVDVPFLLIGGDLTNQPVEFFILKIGDSGRKTYLGPDLQWTDFSQFTDVHPIVQLPMVQGAELNWRMYEDSTGVEGYTLAICFDGTVDGLFPDGENAAAAHCGTVKVNIIRQQQCTGLYVYEGGSQVSSISASGQAGQAVTKQYTVKDDCGNPLTFSVSEAYSWITASSQQGSMTLAFQSSTVGSNSGTITITSGTNTKNLPVTFTVTNTRDCFGLAGDCNQSCTVSSVSLWPNPVTMSAAQGGTASATVSVTNNCAGPVTFTPTVTSGGTWLSASASAGSLTVRANNTAGMASGTYNGTVGIAVSGLPQVTLNVTFTITGPCTPSSAVVSPSSLSKSISPGGTVANETLSVTNNCGSSLAYSVSAVSGSFISAPAVGATGTGSLTVSFNTASLPVGTSNGSITLNATGFSPVTVPVTVTVASSSATAGFIAPGGKVLAQYIDPGEVQYYYFNETSSLGSGNNFRLWVMLEDASQQQGMYNVDMVVRYSGASCNDAMKPTLSDYQAIKAGSIAFGQNGFYFAFAEGAFETIQINNNPEGCYYIMLYNTSAAREMINLYYSDLDSMY